MAEGYCDGDFLGLVTGYFDPKAVGAGCLEDLVAAIDIGNIGLVGVDDGEIDFGDGLFGDGIEDVAADAGCAGAVYEFEETVYHELVFFEDIIAEDGLAIVGYFGDNIHDGIVGDDFGAGEGCLVISELDELVDFGGGGGAGCGVGCCETCRHIVIGQEGSGIGGEEVATLGDEAAKFVPVPICGRGIIELAGFFEFGFLDVGGIGSDDVALEVLPAIEWGLAVIIAKLDGGYFDGGVAGLLTGECFGCEDLEPEGVNKRLGVLGPEGCEGGQLLFEVGGDGISDGIEG